MPNFLHCIFWMVGWHAFMHFATNLNVQFWFLKSLICFICNSDLINSKFGFLNSVRGVILDSRILDWWSLSGFRNILKKTHFQIHWYHIWKDGIKHLMDSNTGRTFPIKSLTTLSVWSFYGQFDKEILLSIIREIQLSKYMRNFVFHYKRRLTIEQKFNFWNQYFVTIMDL